MNPEELVDSILNGDEDEAKKLTAMGYRRTSRRHNIVARIDRPDWKEEMARLYAPWSFQEGMNWVNCLSDTPGGAEDMYRRCYSQDRIEVNRAVIQLIPTSNWDPVGYVEV